MLIAKLKSFSVKILFALGFFYTNSFSVLPVNSVDMIVSELENVISLYENNLNSRLAKDVAFYFYTKLLVAVKGPLFAAEKNFFRIFVKRSTKLLELSPSAEYFFCGWQRDLAIFLKCLVKQIVLYRKLFELNEYFLSQFLKFELLANEIDFYLGVIGKYLHSNFWSKIEDLAQLLANYLELQKKFESLNRKLYRLEFNFNAKRFCFQKKYLVKNLDETGSKYLIKSLDL